MLVEEGERRTEGLVSTRSDLGRDEVPEVIKANAEQAAEEAPPVVENGKFAGCLFGEETDA